MIRGCSTPEKTLPLWSCWWQRNIPCEQQVPNSLQDFLYKYPRLPWVNSKSSSVTREAKRYRTLEEHLAPFNREGLSTWSKTCFTFNLLGLWSPTWRCCRRGGQHLTKMRSPSLGGMQPARLGSQHQARGSAALQQRTEGRRAIYLPHRHTYTLEKAFGQKISWGLPKNDTFLFEEQTTSVQNVVAMNCPRPSPVALPCAAAFSFQEEYRWIQDDSWAVKPSSFLHRKGLIFPVEPFSTVTRPRLWLNRSKGTDLPEVAPQTCTQDHPFVSILLCPSFPLQQNTEQLYLSSLHSLQQQCQRKAAQRGDSGENCLSFKFLWLFLRQRRENGCM